ncbi:MAG: BamA/TamA family outer membrane protein, partial [Thiotrichales bacterium]|nr:BamA/TamA family outer membrane protein [Thiotrichales bacterium]
VSLVERLATYPEGEPYDAGRIVEVGQRLSQSGYFERVDISPRIDRPVAGTIPVDVSLAPRRRHAFTAGAGVTTDAGPRLRLGYEDRRATPGGHRWSVRSAASLIRRSLDAEYRIPLEDARTEWLSVTAGVVGEHTETSRSDEARFGISQTKTRWGDWLETRFVSLTYDDFSVGRTRGIARLLIPGVSLATTRYDDRHRPTDGNRLHVEARGSHEAAGSDVSFLRLSGSTGWVRGVPWGGRLLARAELGAVAVSGFDGLPPSQRFFTGGDSSVRGYELASLGPVDASGTVVGGRMLAVAGIEYEHPVRDKWSVAVFADAGNAFDTGYRNEGLKVGVGIGARWQSPIGAVRLDVARPLDGPERFRLHLRLGPDL